MAYEYDIIKDIKVEVSTEYCKVNAEQLHNVLLSLPAGTYLGLYEIMGNVIRNAAEGVEKRAI